MKPKKLVLIPSAKLIPIELQVDFGSITSAMIPIDGRPALSFIVNEYYDAEFIIGVNEGSEDVYEYCKRYLSDKKITIIDVGNTKNLGETIYNALSSYTNLYDQLIIHFADTLIKNIELSNNEIYFSKLKDSFRWTTFRLNKKNKIKDINDKETEKENNVSLQNVFVGIFSFINIKDFINKLEESLNCNSDIEPFYFTLINYNADNSVFFIECNDWFDFGHIDTYYKSRYKLAHFCRDFNSLKVDNAKGTIFKKSKNVEKFIDEISWYLNLPKSIKYISPRVFDYSLDKKNPSIQLEFYGYPVLNDLYLYGNLDLGTWAIIFNAIEMTLEDFRKFLPSENEVVKFKKSMIDMYEKKTFTRMDMYMDLSQFNWAKNNNLNINGTPCLSINEIYESISTTLDKSKIYSNPEYSIVHGDFCFSNILFDRKNTSIRLIDPRGSFGEFDIYGDPNYDLCKLSHSIEGDYDFFINGLFNFHINDNKISLNPFISNRQKNIKRLYREKIIAQKGELVINQIRLLESLLFLSMIPLHNDRPLSQNALLARGMLLYSETRKYFIEK